jgi:hypothetical protein
VYDQAPAAEANSGKGRRQEGSDEYSERVQIEIIPQDDNWGANSTAVTANADLSDFADDLTEDGRSVVAEPLLLPPARSPFCHAYAACVACLLTAALSLLTPVLFVVLPRLDLRTGWRVGDCGLECEGLLIGIAFKLFIVACGAWVLFARRPRSALPRLLDLSALLVIFMLIMNFSFWLFYVVRIVFEQVEVCLSSHLSLVGHFN